MWRRGSGVRNQTWNSAPQSRNSVIHIDIDFIIFEHSQLLCFSYCTVYTFWQSLMCICLINFGNRKQWRRNFLVFSKYSGIQRRIPERGYNHHRIGFLESILFSLSRGKFACTNGITPCLERESYLYKLGWFYYYLFFSEVDRNLRRILITCTPQPDEPV